MIQLQYDLFEPIPDEMSELKQIVSELKDSQVRQCRAQFAKIGAAGKEMIEMKETVYRLEFEVQALKRMIQS